MKASILAEEILTLMTYAFDLLAMPTYRKWDQSYEGWLHQHGLLRRMQWLEKQKLLAREGKRNQWVYRITDAGRARVRESRDPQAQWSRKWDGWWRMLIFDLPLGATRQRAALLRWLRRNSFGYLQDSVWISPDPVREIAAAVKGVCEDAETFSILESRCAAGFSNDTLVRAAWKFRDIDERYRAYRKVAAAASRRLRSERLHPRDLFALVREERRLWAEAFERDPLLPRELWPAGYEGPSAWRAKQEFQDSLAFQSPRS